MSLQELLGIDLPLIQAPMAGAQGSALALAVGEAGGLGSLACAMLDPEALRAELTALRAQLGQRYNVNFFCHTPAQPDPAREAAWRASLQPRYAEFGIDAARISSGPGRRPFDAAAAELLAEFKPAVVSFHFGLPDAGAAGHRARLGCKGDLQRHHGGRGALARTAGCRPDRGAGARGRRPPRHVPVHRHRHAGRHAGVGAADRARGARAGGGRGRHCRSSRRGGGAGTGRRGRAGRHRLFAVSGKHHQPAAPRGAEERMRRATPR